MRLLLNKKRGFTLVEMTLIIGLILGLMLTLVVGITAYRKGMQKARCLMQADNYTKTVIGLDTAIPQDGWTNSHARNAEFIKRLQPFYGKIHYSKSHYLLCMRDDKTGKQNYFITILPNPMGEVWRDRWMSMYSNAYVVAGNDVTVVVRCVEFFGQRNNGLYHPEHSKLLKSKAQWPAK